MVRRSGTVFVDLEKEYDRVLREEPWYCMMSGVAEKYVRVVQDMLERSMTAVRGKEKTPQKQTTESSTSLENNHKRRMQQFGYIRGLMDWCKEDLENLCSNILITKKGSLPSKVSCSKLFYTFGCKYQEIKTELLLSSRIHLLTSNPNVFSAYQKLKKSPCYSSSFRGNCMFTIKINK